MADLNQTLDERGDRYGKFFTHSALTQSLKELIREHLAMHEKVLEDDQAEALEMICTKIGRIVNGDPNHADSWQDIAGYAQLVADRLDGMWR